MRTGEVLIVVGLTVLSTLLLQAQRHGPTRRTEGPAFVLLITHRYSSAAEAQRFLELIAPLAMYCRDHEPDTLSFEIAVSDKDPAEIMILERYRDKEQAYLKTHRSSEPFLHLKQQLQELSLEPVDKWGQSYLESGLGSV